MSDSGETRYNVHRPFRADRKNVKKFEASPGSH